MLFLRPSQRHRIRLAIAASIVISALDLVGVVLVGLLTAAALSQTQQTDELSVPGLGTVDDPWLLPLGLVAMSLLVVRSAAAWYLNLRLLHYLGRRENEVAVDLLERVQRAPFEQMAGLSTQAVVEGVRWGSRGVVGVIASSVFAIGEFALLVLMGAVSLVVDPLLSLIVGLCFGLVFAANARVTSARLRRAGEQTTSGSLVVGEMVAEAVGLSRETRLYGLGASVRSRVTGAQDIFTSGYADLQGWTQFPRYVLEVAFVLSMALIVASLWIRGGTAGDLAATAVFIAASGRVLPSVLRLQNDVAAIRTSEGQFVAAKPLLALPPAPPLPTVLQPREVSAVTSAPSIRLQDVHYRYPRSRDETLAGISLTIPAGCRTALVGSTGAGKSTLADMLLGLLQPSAGSIAWDAGPGQFVRVAFVPQEVFLTSASVAENVALGRTTDEIDLDDVWAALDAARLADLVAAQTDGIWTTVGERGVRLSGGQRQRLGIARALYRHPSLLVLDEATSALDASTEHDLGHVLGSLQGSVTLVVIAHRLATVRNADLVVLLEDGAVRAHGSFLNVIADNPDFARTARLQGLGRDVEDPKAPSG